MNKQIEKIKNVRKFLLNQIADLTTAQLNQIPAGYNNNIIWNLAHLTAAVQSLCYVRAGQPIAVPDHLYSPYLPGTRPEHALDATEVDGIKAAFLTSIEQLATDFDRQLFDNYSPSERVKERYGVDVNNIHDALEFVLYHEGFHTGYVLALKRLV